MPTRTVLLAIFVLFVTSTARASKSFPDAKDDSIARVQHDFTRFARDYLSLNKPERVQITNMRGRLNLLKLRAERLGGDKNLQMKELLVLIREFNGELDSRLKREHERRKREPKPYIFQSISGPTISEGGHTEKGIRFLKNEVDQFIAHYRQLKTSRFSNNEVYLDGSRSYFRRTMKSAIRTAERRIKNPKPENVTYISKAGGLVYDNYSPRENLQWALDVSRIARYFETRIGAPAHEWSQWEIQIRELADKHKLALN